MSIWRDGSLIPAQCKSCNKISSCMGGCRVGAYPQTGKLDLPDVISRKENVPVKYNRKNSTGDMVEDAMFEVVKGINVLEDGGTIRLSYGRRYTF